MCLLVSCALLFDSFRRLKRFGNVKSCVNPITVRVHAVAFAWYAVAILMWQTAWITGSITKKNDVRAKLFV